MKSLTRNMKRGKRVTSDYEKDQLYLHTKGLLLQIYTYGLMNPISLSQPQRTKAPIRQRNSHTPFYSSSPFFSLLTYRRRKQKYQRLFLPLKLSFQVQWNFPLLCVEEKEGEVVNTRYYSEFVTNVMVTYQGITCG